MNRNFDAVVIRESSKRILAIYGKESKSCLIGSIIALVVAVFSLLCLKDQDVRQILVLFILTEIIYLTASIKLFLDFLCWRKEAKVIEEFLSCLKAGEN